MRDEEFIFYSDVREKKIISHSASKRASRRGYIRGGMRTAYDFLTAKEKKGLNGEVKIMNIYDKYENLDNVPKFVDLKKMIKEGKSEEVKNILIAAKRSNTSNSIRNAINCSSGSLYKLYENVGVPFERKPKTVNKSKKEKGNKKEIATKIKDEVAATSEDSDGISDSILLDKMNTILQVIKNEKSNSNIMNGFNISIGGKYNKKEIEERLLNLTGMLMEDSMYEVNIIITEKNK